jgi:hypothetical protein
MRIIAAIAFTLYAAQGLAQTPTPNDDVLSHALSALPQHVGGLLHDALPRTADLHHYAIANVTAGGADASIFHAGQQFYSTVLADDLLAAYAEANRASTRLQAERVAEARVLDLGDFAAGDSYDWERLNAQYPDVKGVIRISRPAEVAGYALVRVDIIAPTGVAWLNVMELQRQSDGSWRHTRGLMGGPRDFGRIDPPGAKRPAAHPF